jgi:deoxyguanosinetriphosphate triphosphohydrolase, putative
MDKNYAAPNEMSILTKRFTKEEKETSIIIRDPFQRDRDRVVHSRAFRRLMHKTQIFNANKGDHYRNRLTHSLEVNQIARSIGKALKLNDELIEAIALGHDLGHTPFGHVGERTLHMILSGRTFKEDNINIAGHSGFKHNFQGLQVVDNIENSSDEYEGMNLTLAVREGILKHTKRKMNIWLPDEKGVITKHIDEVKYESLDLTGINIDKVSFTLEGQVVAIADEIAQCTHDLEDGIRANIISIDSVLKMDLVQKIIKEHHINTDKIKITVDARNILIKVMVGYLINDVYLASKNKLEEEYKNKEIPKFSDYNDVYTDEMIVFSEEIKNLVEKLSNQITKLVLMSQKISQTDSKAEYIIKQLFKAYYTHPQQLPDYILLRYYRKNGKDFDRINIEKDTPVLRQDIKFYRLICDHIASMTDQYAAREYKKLYEPEYF